MSFQVSNRSIDHITKSNLEERQKGNISKTFLDVPEVLYVLASPDRKDWKYPLPAVDLITMLTSDSNALRLELLKLAMSNTLKMSLI